MRVLIGAVIGGIVMFGWGWVSWGMLDWHKTSGYQLSNTETVVAALKAGGAEKGVYWLPGIARDKDPMTDEDFKKRMEAGPVGILAYDPGGRDADDMMWMARGAAINIIAALVAALLLAAAGIGNFFGRFLFVTGIGVIIAVFGDGSAWNYMHFPTDWTKVMAADHIAGWALVGIVLAMTVKPKEG